ncbi:MAG: inorganic phosphate transporter [Gammaproteobacteria bacterium]|nr:inorganic phosphate transporter [Gammaproteobacteria bacterium]
MLTNDILLVVITISLAFIFDFLNGFHDAANSIATVVSTRVLKPHWAVAWAAFFNFSAIFFFGVHVANTIGTGLIDPSIITVMVVLISLISAIVWNIITWYYGIPSSSSHALIGGMLGAAIAKSGWGFLNFYGLAKVILAIVISPFIGFIIGQLLMLITIRIFFNFSPSRTNSIFRKMQIFSSALISLGHGGNDAQKTMGIIAVLLFSTGSLGENFYVPMWVTLGCYFVISLGTIFGGWRIVKTMGMKITKLKPVSGCCAETASALTLFLATGLGIPVSTTHTITGSIIGVGSLQSTAAVRWGVARNIVYAWVLTIPAAAILAGGLWFLTSLFISNIA